MTLRTWDTREEEPVIKDVSEWDRPLVNFGMCELELALLRRQTKKKCTAAAPRPPGALRVYTKKRTIREGAE